MIVINGPDEFEQYIGKEEVSDYHVMGQEQITNFADATGDQNWIHVDVERATKESPFDNSTIAHGYLSLSVIPRILDDMIDVRRKMGVNYGLNNLRFLQPVKAGAKYRIRASLKEYKNLKGRIRATFNQAVEVEGASKPSLTLEATYLYEF